MSQRLHLHVASYALLVIWKPISEIITILSRQAQWGLRILYFFVHAIWSSACISPIPHLDPSVHVSMPICNVWFSSDKLRNFWNCSKLQRPNIRFSATSERNLSLWTATVNFYCLTALPQQALPNNSDSSSSTLTTEINCPENNTTLTVNITSKKKIGSYIHVNTHMQNSKYLEAD